MEQFKPRIPHWHLWKTTTTKLKLLDTAGSHSFWHIHSKTHKYLMNKIRLKHLTLIEMIWPLHTKNVRKGNEWKMNDGYDLFILFSVYFCASIINHVDNWIWNVRFISSDLIVVFVWAFFRFHSFHCQFCSKLLQNMIKRILKTVEAQRQYHFKWFYWRRRK